MTLRLLHVLNGTDTSNTLAQSNVHGTYVPYADVLHDGPVPAGLTDEQMRVVRATFIADCGWASYDAALRTGASWDAAVADYAHYDEVVFWFEHDLFDQLLLIRHLNWFGSRDLGATRLMLICIDAFAGVEPFYGLGQLSATELESLLPTRREVTRDQIALARKAWTAFTSADPRDIERVVAKDTSALPFLDGALRRHLQEFPAASNGLPRTEREILTVLDASGALSPDTLFRATQGFEERVYMGDASFWRRVEALADPAAPLVVLNGLVPRSGRLPEGAVAIAALGRAVLQGDRDWIRLRGIDRWLGGVHLKTPGEIWRCNEENHGLERC